MLSKLIAQSVRNPLLVGVAMLLWIAFGLYSASRIPLDAVPDITNNQVQIVTQSPSLTAEEVEQFITYPLELVLTNLPRVEQVRSISKFGLSIVTVIFEEGVPDLQARQLVAEQLNLAAKDIPQELGVPEMMPITTGLGEIYQYVLRVKEDSPVQYSTAELRTIQDWVVKRQLSGIEGIIEISSFGGDVKQYEVVPDPVKMRAYGVDMEELAQAVDNSNHSTGGSYYERGQQAFYVRANGRYQHPDEIAMAPLRPLDHAGVLRVGDVAEVHEGRAVRFGAMTMDGGGEVVGGITLMLKGANANATVRRVKERVEVVQASLPDGVELAPYLDRAALVDRTTSTVAKNLIEGGLIVIFVLILLLGNIRAGLVVASVIPLAMLFALILMNAFGVSANLMSLGAIDFGIVVDGAVIVTEHVMALLIASYGGKRFTKEKFQAAVIGGSNDMIKSAVFGVIIILVVFIPVATLVGIEGKMFRPMALTVSFALLGALILSVTYVPSMLALVLPKKGIVEPRISHRINEWLMAKYGPGLRWSLKNTRAVVLGAVLLFAVSVFGFLRMGSEFIPTLEEGDIAAQMQLPSGSSLSESVVTATAAERLLMAEFPEVVHVVSKIGTAEVPTDPMSIEQADMMILLKDKAEWTSAETREELVGKMSDLLAEHVPSAAFEFTQPIELRFNELISGAKSDVALKIFGPDFETLSRLADEAVSYIDGVEGAVDVRREVTDGLNQRHIRYDRAAMSSLGVNVRSANRVVEAAFAGAPASTLYEDDRRFDIVVRYDEALRSDAKLDELLVANSAGDLVPFSAFAEFAYAQGPAMVSRENSQRRIVVGFNVRERDVESVVEDVQVLMNAKLALPPGYYLSYGGDFEQLQHAKSRLMIAVPAALVAIFILLYLTFGKLQLALIIFTTVPLSAIGGVATLLLRGMPFSISAGIGFIALFGVAVLNGIVMVSQLNQERREGPWVERAALTRLRPVLMTALVAALGFLPMALSSGAGAEVQKPLATVVIGGLVSSTLLTLLVLPAVFNWWVSRSSKPSGGATSGTVVGLLLLLMTLPFSTKAQQQPVVQLESARAFLAEQSVATQQARWAREAVRHANATDWALPTNVQGQRGQINGALTTDYFITAEVELPGLLQWPALRAAHRAKLSAADAALDYATKWSEYELEVAWMRFEEGQQQYDALDAFYSEALEVQARLATRSKAGLLAARDSLRWHVLVEEVHHELKLARARANQQRLAVNALLGWPADSLWAAAPRTMDPAPLSALSGPEQSVLLAPVKGAADISAAERTLAKRAWMPAIGAGAFVQRLDGTPGFTGVQASVRVPLNPTTHGHRVAEKQAHYQIAQWDLVAAEREWRAAVAQLQTELALWTPEDHHEGAEKQVLPWAAYDSGALDLEGLWGVLDAHYQSERLSIEHRYTYLQVVLAWNFYQLKAND